VYIVPEKKIFKDSLMNFMVFQRFGSWK